MCYSLALAFLGESKRGADLSIAFDILNVPRSIIGNNGPIITYYRPSNMDNNRSIITVIIGNNDLAIIGNNDVITDIIMSNNGDIITLITGNNVVIITG